MIKSWARFSCAALIITTTFPALALENENKGTNHDSRLYDLQISRQGDIELSCGSLSHEAAAMRDIIYSMEEVKDNSTMQGHGVAAAGAVGSFLIGTVTGGIGLAVGGLFLDYNIDERQEKADELQDIAEQRRTLMMGIHNAKGCHGPLEHAMQNPQGFDPLDQIAAAAAATQGPVYHADLRRRYNN